MRTHAAHLCDAERRCKDAWEPYRKGRVLGQGSYGTTYLAVDSASNQQVAIKEISKRRLATAAEVEDVQREVQIMHHLQVRRRRARALARSRLATPGLPGRAHCERGIRTALRCRGTPTWWSCSRCTRTRPTCSWSWSSVRVSRRASRAAGCCSVLLASRSMLNSRECVSLCGTQAQAASCLTPSSPRAASPSATPPRSCAPSSAWWRTATTWAWCTATSSQRTFCWPTSRPRRCSRLLTLGCRPFSRSGLRGQAACTRTRAGDLLHAHTFCALLMMRVCAGGPSAGGHGGLGLLRGARGAQALVRQAGGHLVVRRHPLHPAVRHAALQRRHGEEDPP